MSKRNALWVNLAVFLLTPFLIGLVTQYARPDWFWGPVMFLLIVVECVALVAPFVIIEVME